MRLNKGLKWEKIEIHGAFGPTSITPTPGLRLFTHLSHT